MKEDSSYLEAKEALLKSGWQNEDLLLEPVMYVQGRLYHFDIVLLYNLFPLAVVEIKRNIVSPELVLPLSVVDNSALSPTRLTIPRDPVYPS